MSDNILDQFDRHCRDRNVDPQTEVWEARYLWMVEFSKVCRINLRNEISFRTPAHERLSIIKSVWRKCPFSDMEISEKQATETALTNYLNTEV